MAAMRGSAAQRRDQLETVQPGIITSLMTRSGTCARMASSACRPSVTPRDLIAGGPQQVGQVFTHVGVVVGDQHAGQLATRPRRGLTAIVAVVLLPAV